MDYTESYETYMRLVQLSHLLYTAKSHRLQWNVRQISQNLSLLLPQLPDQGGILRAFCRTV